MSICWRVSSSSVSMEASRGGRLIGGGGGRSETTDCASQGVLGVWGAAGGGHAMGGDVTGGGDEGPGAAALEGLRSMGYMLVR